MCTLHIFVLVCRFGVSYSASVGPGYPQVCLTIGKVNNLLSSNACQVFYFEFPSNTSGIRLRLESESHTCAFISVQNTSVSVFEFG